MTPIFKDASEVRAFITWCRQQKVQLVEVAGIKVVFSSLAMMPDPRDVARGKKKSAKPPKVDERTGFTEEELYGSSG